MYPTREKAWEIFTEYNKDEHLIKHGLTVEGVSRRALQKNYRNIK